MATSAALLFIAWLDRGHAADPVRPIDVSLVRPDDCAAMVIHPRRIARSPLAAELLKDETVAEVVKKFGFDPADVEEIVLLAGKSDDKPPLPPVTVVMLTRFTHDVDVKEVLVKFQVAVGPPRREPLVEVPVGGKTCFDLGTAFDAPRAHALSKNTIVMTWKENMKNVLAVSEPKGPLVERLKKADADNDVILAVEGGDYPDRFLDDLKRNASPLLASYLDAAKTLQRTTATFNLSAPSLLHAALEAKDADAAGIVDGLLQKALKMAGDGLDSAKQNMPKESQTPLGPLVKLAEESIDNTEITRSGSESVLNVARPEMLDTARASIVAAVRQTVIDARAAARRAQQANNLRQIALAMIVYESTHRSFPPAASEKDGKPLLSWRVAILPFLGEEALYQKFHLDEPWDSPNNRDLVKQMPAVFQPLEGPKDGKTRIMVFTGKGAAFDGGKTIGNMDIHDGASFTIMFVEAGAEKAVPWTKPEDLPFDAEKPTAALGKAPPQGFMAAFFDGSVLSSLKVDDKTLKALITPAGGEAIDMAKVRGGR
jgi:hypothetical protein